MREMMGYNPEQEEKKAEYIRKIEAQTLWTVGLTFDDLEASRAVADIGAGGAEVEEAAQLRGINNIVAIDAIEKNLRRGSKTAEDEDLLQRFRYANPKKLPRVLAEANALPMEDGSFDRLMAIHFPLEEHDLKEGVLKEFERVMTPDGDGRIFPALILDVRDRLAKERGLKEVLDIPHHKRTPDQCSRVLDLQQECAKQSMELLRQYGHNVEMRLNKQGVLLSESDPNFERAQFADRYYWQILKSEQTQAES